MSASKSVYLIVTSYFPDPGNRWAGVFGWELADAIARHSDYRVVVLKVGYRGADYVFGGIETYGFRQLAGGRWLVPGLINAVNCRQMMDAIRRAGVAPEDIKVVHAHQIGTVPYLAYLKKRIYGVKTLLHFHDNDPMGMLLGNTRFKKRRYFTYHQRLLKFVDQFVAISQPVADVLREAPKVTRFPAYRPMLAAVEQLAGIERTRDLAPIYVLHNGVDTRVFTACGRTRRNPSEGFTIGCVGLYWALKGQIDLLRAAVRLRNRIPGLKLKLVGYGDELAACQAYAAEQGLNVEFIRVIEHDDLPMFYRSLDLFVLPSCFEGFGCVYMEAHACGTPFIGCEGQGVEDMVRPEERGLWLCRAHDPDDLAEKIYAYYRERPQQRLAAPIAFDEIVPPFLKEIS